MGVLSGLKIVEMAGIGPAPFCGMLLADHGADVVRVTRPGHGAPLPLPPQYDLCNRGRPLLMLDMRLEADRVTLTELIRSADALIEGFRPGVMEKLGFGPQDVANINPRLVYGRITGWGQSGPMSALAGHDLNYAGLSGAIAAIGPAGGPPSPPLNLVADFGGGAMLLAFGLLAALLEAQRSGKGQVVDAAMIDGSALLMTMFQGFRAAGVWSLQPGANLLDGGAPFYACYRTQDGKYMSVCPLEPKFFATLLDKLNLIGDPDFRSQFNLSVWPRMRDRLSTIFASETRAHWTAYFADSDACVAPVLDMDEAPFNPQNQARGNFTQANGVTQAAPAPHFSRTPAAPIGGVETHVSDAEAILARWRNTQSA